MIALRHRLVSRRRMLSGASSDREKTMFTIKDTRQYCLVLKTALMLPILVGLPTAARADAVTDWNAYGVSAVLTAARAAGGYVDLAYMHISMYDAVNAIDGRY